MGEVLCLYVIYDHPKDDPSHFVCRRFDARDGESVPGDVFARDAVLDEIRAKLARRGLVKMARHESDDPVIIETWF